MVVNRVLTRRAVTGSIALLVAVGLAAPTSPAFATDPVFDGSAPFAVTTGGIEPYGLAASADGKYVYVSNLKSASLQVIDTGTATVIKSIDLESGGSGVAVAPDGSVWVTESDANRLSRIADPLAAQPAVVSRPLPAESKSGALAFSRDGSKVYVTEPGLKQVQAYATSTNGGLLHTTPAGSFQNQVTGIAIASDGSVWTGGDALTAFPADLSSKLHLTGVTAGGFTGAPELSPDGASVYFGRGESIDKIDIASGTLLDSMSTSTSAGISGCAGCTVLGEEISQLAFTPDGKTLYATNFDYPWRTRIDVAQALDGQQTAFQLMPGPTANGADATDDNNWQYSNQMLVVGDALWSAVDGFLPALNGTIVQRDPIAPQFATHLSGKVYAGSTVVITGSGLAEAKVLLGGKPVALTQNTFSRISFTVPLYASNRALAVAVTTPSSGASPVSVGSLSYTLRGLTKSRPTISGKLKVGKTVKVSRHSWTSGTKFTYQWYASGKRIPKATKSSYKIAKKYAGKRLTVTVTGSKSGYATAKMTSKSSKKIARR